MSRRRARNLLGPWLLAGAAVWLALDNGPALLDEWSLRTSGQTGTATVLATSGARPQRAVRRVSDDLFWGRSRRVEYRFATGDATYSTAVAFVTHHSADALQDGAAVRVRYLPSDPTIHRIEGEPGVLLLSFRLVCGLVLAGLCMALLRGPRVRSGTQPAPQGTSA